MILLIAGLFLALLTSPSRLPAQIRWTGGAGTGNWATATKWNPAIVPASGACMTFQNSAQTTINLQANRTAATLLFETGADAFTLQNFVLTPTTINSSGVTQTIASAIGDWPAVAPSPPTAASCASTATSLSAAPPLTAPSPSPAPTRIPRKKNGRKNARNPQNYRWFCAFQAVFTAVNPSRGGDPTCLSKTQPRP